MTKSFIPTKLLIKALAGQKRILNLVIALLLVFGIVFGSGVIHQGLFTQPAFAQSYRLRDVWQQVYKQLPDLPLENQYIDKETRKVDADNTLVNRLVSYHIYVKGRAPIYRLDWKLTLADYLGANEIMQEETYPGYETLRESPLEGDRTAIERLNRRQRNALVQTLVNIFNSNSSEPASQAPPQPSVAPSPVTQPNSL